MRHLYYRGVIYVAVEEDYDDWACILCAKHFLVPHGFTPVCCPYSLLPYDASDWPEVLALWRNHIPQYFWSVPAESRAEFERDRFGTAGPARPIAR